MADTKISALPAATQAADTDEFAIAQAGESKKVTLAQVLAETDPAGSAQAVADDLAAHEADLANPHQVDATQVGADPAGSASGAVAAHESGTDVHSIAATTGLQDALDEKIEHATSDGQTYGSKDGAWSPVPIQPITGASMEYVWDSSTAATAPDSPGGIKANNADQALASEIYIDDLTSQDNDFSFLFDTLASGDFLQISETGGGADGSNTYQVTGPATDKTGWWAIPVVNAHTDGTMTNNKSVIFTFVKDPRNKLPVGGAIGQPLIKSGPEDYNTEWGNFLVFYKDDGITPVGIVSRNELDGSLVIYYTNDPAGEYNPQSGGFRASSNGSAIHGSAVIIEKLAGTGLMDLQAIDGQIIAVEPPEPGWTETDTSALVHDFVLGNVQTPWIDTLLQIAVPTDTPLGTVMNVTARLNVAAQNNKNTSMTVAGGINGGAPSGVTISQPVAGDFAGLLAFSLAFETTQDLTAGDTIEIHSRVEASSQNAHIIIDGSETPHDVRVDKMSESGATGESNYLTSEGTGESLVGAKVGEALGVKSITGTGGATVSATATEVNIDVAGAGNAYGTEAPTGTATVTMSMGVDPATSIAPAAASVVTLTFDTLPTAGKTVKHEIKVDSSAAPISVGFSQSIEWAGGVGPDLTTGTTFVSVRANGDGSFWGIWQ